jgi:hypothetical protein
MCGVLRFGIESSLVDLFLLRFDIKKDEISGRCCKKNELEPEFLDDQSINDDDIVDAIVASICLTVKPRYYDMESQGFNAVDKSN